MFQHDCRNSEQLLPAIHMAIASSPAEVAFQSDLTLRFKDGSSLPAKQYMLGLASPVLRGLFEECGRDGMELKVSGWVSLS